MLQIILHVLGDFIFQSSWMADNKKKLNLKGEFACQAHCISYSLPFLFIGSWRAVLVIYATHYIIDRTNIVAWFLAYRNGVKTVDNYGFSQEQPYAMSLWLYIITDNFFHIVCNFLALTFL